MYSSQRMKDWNNIVSLYQKNSIYLAETASILMRNVAFEIPALKKQVHKCQQQQTVYFYYRYLKIVVKSALFHHK